MKFLKYLLLLIACSLQAFDYDCVFVGTSPIPLFEALYQASLGKKVLILEASSECGGAWKSIDICGIQHVDLGCHLIGSDRNLADFLIKYGGCQLVSLDHPENKYDPAHPSSGQGFYFSKGCFELIDHLQKMIASSSIDLMLDTPLERVTFDSSNQFVWVHIQGRQLSAQKVFLTPTSSFAISHPPSPNSSKYPHLYLLIADSTPPRFSYYYHTISGVSRMMNLTHFSGLAGTGRQLICFQLHGKEIGAEDLLTELKRAKLVDPSSYLLQADSYTYEQRFSAYQQINQLPVHHKMWFEVLHTGSFAGMSSYLAKWKQNLQPYTDYSFNY